MSALKEATHAGIKAASARTNTIIEKEADNKIDKEVPPSLIRTALKVAASGAAASATTLAFTLLMNKIFPKKIQQPSLLDEIGKSTIETLSRAMSVGLGVVLGVTMLAGITAQPKKP